MRILCFNFAFTESVAPFTGIQLPCELSARIDRSGAENKLFNLHAASLRNSIVECLALAGRSEDTKSTMAVHVVSTELDRELKQLQSTLQTMTGTCSNLEQEYLRVKATTDQRTHERSIVQRDEQP
jgi:hypothetical protein